MPGANHPTDALVAELGGLFDRSTARLEALVDAGLRRGLDPGRAGTVDAIRGDATQAYRARQLAQAHAILAELRSSAARASPIAVGRAYRAGVVAVDRTALHDGAELGGRFAGVHLGAAQALAANMTTALDEACQRTGKNIADVFARADALAAGLPVGGHGVGFLGRRTDDAWRQAGLEEVGQGLVTGQTRRQISANLARRLIRDGTTDALTGYVTRNGARLPLGHYARMVARTTTREAVSRGTVNRLTEAGIDLVTISSHPHKSDECDDYDGQTFSLDGSTPGYETLDQLPPFHPNCLHVVGPALVNLDRFEEELGTAAVEVIPPEELKSSSSPAAAAAAAVTKTTPEGKIAARIADELAAGRKRVGDAALEGELGRQGGGGYAQVTRTMRAYHAGPDAIANLDPGDRELLERVQASDYVAETRAAAELLAPGELLGEDATTAIGRDVRRLIDRRVKAKVKRIDAELERIRAESDIAGQAYGDRMQELMPKRATNAQGLAVLEHPDLLALKAKSDELTDRYIKARQERAELPVRTTRETLAAIRPGYGKGELAGAHELPGPDGSRIAAGANGGDARRTLDDFGPGGRIAPLLPREWVEASNAVGRVHLNVTPRRGVRAFHLYAPERRRYAVGPTELTLEPGDSLITTPAGDFATAVHEFTHRLEEVVPGIRRLEASFYGRRTRGEELELLSDLVHGSGYGSHERARPDKWASPYMGKDYGGQAWELLTMGLQRLVEGTELDDDYREWMLGLLAAV